MHTTPTVTAAVPIAATATALAAPKLSYHIDHIELNRRAAAAQASAEAFEQTLRQLCPGDPPVLDLILLGLGDDGHTASLFPGSEAAGVSDRPVAVGEGKGLERITLTAPVLSAARQVVFLVGGKGKQEALRRLLDPSESPLRTPAKLVQPRTPVLVLADVDAAGLVAGGA